MAVNSGIEIDVGITSLKNNFLNHGAYITCNEKIDFSIRFHD